MIGGDDKKKRRGASAPSQAGLYGGTLRPRAAKAKKKKPKVVNYRTRGKGMKMLCAGYGKGRRTSKSCRN